MQPGGCGREAGPQGCRLHITILFGGAQVCAVPTCQRLIGYDIATAANRETESAIPKQEQHNVRQGWAPIHNLGSHVHPSAADGERPAFNMRKSDGLGGWVAGACMHVQVLLVYLYLCV